MHRGTMSPAVTIDVALLRLGKLAFLMRPGAQHFLHALLVRVKLCVMFVPRHGDIEQMLVHGFGT